MIQAKRALLAALGDALKQVAPEAPDTFAPAFEAPKQAAHGDLAVTAAMQLAKATTSGYKYATSLARIVS